MRNRARRRRSTFFLASLGGIALGLAACGAIGHDTVPPTTSRAAGVQQVQLADNPGFENPGDPVPKGWTWDLKRSGNKGTVTTDNERVHSGRASLKLVPNGENIADDPLSVIQIIPAGAYRGGEVEFSGYMAGEGDTQSILGMMSLVRGRPQGPPVMLFQQGSASPEWERRSRVYKVPDDPSVQLILICMSNGKSGASWFDDLAVVPVGSTGAAQARGGEPAGASDALQATVQVDAGDVIRRIPSTLYGTNVEWRWNGLGLWDQKQDRLDPRLVELTRQLGVTLIRYPGGYLSDFYHWRDGVGPRAKRPVVKHQPGRGEESRPLFGTDEALDFARRVNAQLLLTVNAGTGTAEEAAGWVRYVNGKQQRVRYWEVGNELYLRLSTPVSEAVTVDPETYARRFGEFADSMRAADPGITLAAIGGVNQGRYAFVGYPRWLSTVLRRQGENIDLVSVHDAYAPLIADDNVDFDAVYHAMLAAPKLIARNLRSVADTIDRYAPAGRASKIGIAVTEWGPAFRFDLNSRWVDHVKTLGSALFAASAMKTFIESPRVQVANFQLLNDFSVYGAIGSDNTDFPLNPHWIPTARYYAFQLYTKHFGDRLVRSTADGPTFDSPAVGFVDAVNDAPYLDVVASLNDDGSRLYLIGINKHFDKPIETTITLDGFEPASGATAWTLNGTGLDANTGTGIVEAPNVRVPRQAEAPDNPRFRKGGPGEITFDSSSVAVEGKSFVYRFPAHSATSIVLVRR